MYLISGAGQDWLIMRKRCSIVGALLLLATSPASALFDDFNDLEGETVIAAGDLKKLECPIGGDYNCLTWPVSFYRLDQRCLEVTSGYLGGYGLRGLLTVDGNGAVSLFSFAGLGSSDVSRDSVSLYDCPLGLY